VVFPPPLTTVSSHCVEDIYPVLSHLLLSSPRPLVSCQSLALCIRLIYLREKATISGQTPCMDPPRLFPGCSRRLKRLIFLGRLGVTLAACCFPLFPARQNLVLSPRVFPGIPLLLFIYSRFRELVRDKHIVYLSMLCTSFLFLFPRCNFYNK